MDFISVNTDFETEFLDGDLPYTGAHLQLLMPLWPHCLSSGTVGLETTEPNHGPGTRLDMGQ